ncbi:hypothetical protein CYLTODRAFT_491161 [Cylindrobasidium torrendii FP15055 ss-10]|uniref:F-box domain-containing protein n=1 Tax=Cylindrobasidium torrendii FP15055 ss-10 TaxID=1314674 RepID=A0A0D7B8E1_9AGAR|nr:hypothetical protein CYLTODRAFT_491161 [Cylindrobasidium torrendii FP15055 ss-10]
MYLPAELKGLILEELFDIDVGDSIALVWRETWHDIRTLRFRYVDFDDYRSRSVSLPNLLDIIKTAPEVARYIKEINVGKAGDWKMGFLGHWSQEEGICENLASLIKVARHAEELYLHKMVPILPVPESQEYGVLQSAFQASSIRHLHLCNAWFVSPERLLEFIGLFPKAESIEMPDGWPEQKDRWMQPLPQCTQIYALEHSYVSNTDRRFLRLLADRPIFPNIQSFTMRFHARSFIPILRRLLVQWSTTLTYLALPYLAPAYVPVGEAPLQLPPGLTTLNIGVEIVNGQRPCLEFITNTLFQNKPIGKLMLVVSYSHQCASFMTPAEIDAIARLDTAIVERVEFLEWEGVLARPCTCTSRDAPNCTFQDICRTADRWMFKQALPKVTEKFFAEMPSPEPGDFHRGKFATRGHWSYDSDSGSDDEDEDV